MKKYLLSETSIIPRELVTNITVEELSDLYDEEDFSTDANISFALFHNYYWYKEQKLIVEAAYLSYLISYYFFILFTTPFCYEIALKHAKEACEMVNKKEYKEWLDYVYEGN
ncbi:hypothetical protein SAMN05216249_11634 [Acetitomaculum ruminis DSM 5522]|uniref:Uncharacterized protein n=1 Tax=Acetitomaculum ruminis DSM 5522 TaxID=1120918 RepID=A0A1I0ZN13_9FIRM|nr:hypothetical protein [Acetitomaculum ruminis]SFB26752.1 hypothetical protein SAMN05216249_11634 [Acetitomaculum ruminis DSM 5522]